MFGKVFNLGRTLKFFLGNGNTPVNVERVNFVILHAHASHQFEFPHTPVKWACPVPNS